MNSVGVYRQSIINTRIKARQPVYKERAVIRPKPFRPVDWPSFKQECEEQRAPSAIIDNYELPIHEVGSEPPLISFLGGLKRVCTVYPYRDLQWIVALLFFIGSSAFAVRSLLILVPTMYQETALDDRIKAGFPTVTVVGAAILLFGNQMTIFAAFNINRGVEDKDENIEEKGQSLTEGYHPALLGSKEWTWWPPFAELKSDFLLNPAFRAGIMSMLGIWTLTTSAIAGIPGVIHESTREYLLQFRHFVVFPQIVGGGILALAALRLMTLTQSRWYKPAFFSLAWHSSCLNMLGAGFISASGIITLTVPGARILSALANMAGAWLLLVASFIHLLMVVELYP
ncbi:hypothetical protein HIM_10342 [Hirsutella minnesotensis 3608]|uniref:Uncharacterized protein n=1 Tax=Hirsutella minnesotensis 3608 TaxID=1043627 RepID=A0A0F7ZG47_9HYPO|nr:hypothetical protein HIM_10342 [Hirsutella minnesotensis 3608]